jgi:hypothetical protein
MRNAVNAIPSFLYIHMNLSVELSRAQTFLIEIQNPGVVADILPILIVGVIASYGK